MSTIFGVDRRKLSGFDFSEAEWRGTRGSERKWARFRRRSAAATEFARLLCISRRFSFKRLKTPHKHSTRH